MLAARPNQPDILAGLCILFSCLNPFIQHFYLFLHSFCRSTFYHVPVVFFAFSGINYPVIFCHVIVIVCVHVLIRQANHISSPTSYARSSVAKFGSSVCSFLSKFLTQCMLVYYNVTRNKVCLVRLKKKLKVYVCRKVLDVI